MAIERTREEMPHGDQEQDHTLDRHKLGIRTLHCRSLFSPEVVAGTLQDIVYLICTGTVQCLWPSLRGGGVEHVMIGVCSAQHCPVQPWNNRKEAPRWVVAEIQKMSPSITGRCK